MTTDAMTATAPLSAFAASYKTSRKAIARVRKIGAFFAPDIDTATVYAARVVDEETFGDGVLLNVYPTDDPRDPVTYRQVGPTSWIAYQGSRAIWEATTEGNLIAKLKEMNISGAIRTPLTIAIYR